MERITQKDKETYQKISQSAWYKAWKAVKAWYPYRRKMKSFYLFVEAFEKRDRIEIIRLAKRFKMNGSTLCQIIEAFDKFEGLL